MTTSTIRETISYLIAQVGRMHRNRAAELLSSVDLYVGQEMFLLHLWQEDGLTLSKIVDCLDIQPATVTRMVDRMETAGLVERKKDPGDARVSRVYLTETGRRLQEPVQALWQELERHTLATFTMEERLLLHRLLLQLSKNLAS